MKYYFLKLNFNDRKSAEIEYFGYLFYVWAGVKMPTSYFVEEGGEYGFASEQITGAESGTAVLGSKNSDNVGNPYYYFNVNFNFDSKEGEFYFEPDHNPMAQKFLLKGMLRLLIVAALLQDIDCIHASYSNFFLKKIDALTYQVINIDTGHAFFDVEKELSPDDDYRFVLTEFLDDFLGYKSSINFNDHEDVVQHYNLNLYNLIPKDHKAVRDIVEGIAGHSKEELKKIFAIIYKLPVSNDAYDDYDSDYQLQYSSGNFHLSKHTSLYEFFFSRLAMLQESLDIKIRHNLGAIRPYFPIEQKNSILKFYDFLLPDAEHVYDDEQKFSRSMPLLRAKKTRLLLQPQAEVPAAEVKEEGPKALRGVYQHRLSRPSKVVRFDSPISIVAFIRKSDTDWGREKPHDGVFGVEFTRTIYALSAAIRYLGCDQVRTLSSVRGEREGAIFRPIDNMYYQSQTDRPVTPEDDYNLDGYEPYHGQVTTPSPVQGGREVIQRDRIAQNHEGSVMQFNGEEDVSDTKEESSDSTPSSNVESDLSIKTRMIEVLNSVKSREGLHGNGGPNQYSDNFQIIPTMADGYCAVYAIALALGATDGDRENRSFQRYSQIVKDLTALAPNEFRVLTEGFSNGNFRTFNELFFRWIERKYHIKIDIFRSEGEGSVIQYMNDELETSIDESLRTVDDARFITTNPIDPPSTTISILNTGSSYGQHWSAIAPGQEAVLEMGISNRVSGMFNSVKSVRRDSEVGQLIFGPTST